jgi:DMSO/TMAO reductase YedYZ molybdopterin-dependent catalytic subunit
LTKRLSINQMPRGALAATTSSNGMLQMNGYAVNAETPLELLTDYLTPVELFFVRSHWIPHMPDPGAWRLRVDGDVETSMEFTLAQLRKLPVTEVTCVLQCAGNGRWRGVRVKDVLDKVTIKLTAKHLHIYGTDNPLGNVPPFHRSVEMEKAAGVPS